MGFDSLVTRAARSVKVLVLIGAILALSLWLKAKYNNTQLKYKTLQIEGISCIVTGLEGEDVSLALQNIQHRPLRVVIESCEKE